MLLFWRFVVLGFTLMVGCRLAQAGADIAVSKAFARPTAGQMGSTALYFTLINEGSSPDELVSVTADVAKLTEMHQSKVENGVVSMVPVETLNLPPGTTVVFQPKAYHVMMMMVARPLTLGDHIKFQLNFKTHAAEIADAIVAMTPPQ